MFLAPGMSVRGIHMDGIYQSMCLCMHPCLCLGALALAGKASLVNFIRDFGSVFNLLCRLTDIIPEKVTCEGQSVIAQVGIFFF
ncbi:hypothetical protein DPMN_075669 [Dreissena polymorpha]|uniref:Uncharacterized protein n=1 Tax=Dreissena polymorpha TaxID=45954 RepID=A0A9D3YHP2_DREPO|nr:hypothetical protein DPMN_075669 [Dreissena polymorpha]